MTQQQQVKDLKRQIERIEVDRMTRPLSPAESDRYRLLRRMLAFFEGNR